MTTRFSMFRRFSGIAAAFQTWLPRFNRQRFNRQRFACQPGRPAGRKSMRHSSWISIHRPK
jgi:hypothetical protein